MQCIITYSIVDIHLQGPTLARKLSQIGTNLGPSNFNSIHNSGPQLISSIRTILINSDAASPSPSRPSGCHVRMSALTPPTYPRVVEYPDTWGLRGSLRLPTVHDCGTAASTEPRIAQPVGESASPRQGCRKMSLNKSLGRAPGGVGPDDVFAPRSPRPFLLINSPVSLL